MHRPKELWEFLQKLGVHPHKGLSQNFLIDGNIVRKIVETAHVSPGDYVVEIGPGPGALTVGLLEKGASVLAIEKDAVFARELSRLQNGRLVVISGDALEVSFETCLQRPTKIVANLPYHIATPLITKLAPLNQSIVSLTVMVQKEVADRMLAHPKTPLYSSLSVFMHFYTKIEKTFIVEPSCFYPRPKVRSTVIHCSLIPPPFALASEERFFHLTRSLFQQKRKMIRSSLKHHYPNLNIEQTLSKASLDPKSRPQDLSLDDFRRLFEEIDKPQTDIER